ncbi:uncharacterized protein MONOS_11890 [Monocercomonoides exilis]|uniref:uncharacterized protein n=1 Tax=Monocercomonoides exilis TaxID=2049356 RepID=UPI003559FCC0|nr:hypothetical protein MONOS_11890 [Monocercomonoides exilis]|eukprot:MONOS_11890.1-p1 / transcript=MONOS_11890.1 / gene=MONOS_11890 / organism=Monocercomonoides_exilis_PA203 / gene_product=unspecified product / transcript_product=unspecified product / location=Mono_scaffold00622:12136-12456(+) / protein_length=107 / sequence_SO=supercontig / SO=protein_coding / is_pseudo=false
MSNNPTQHIAYYHIICPWRQQQQRQPHATRIHLSSLSLPSITVANVYDADKIGASEGSIAGDDDKDEDEEGLSPPAIFFSSLLRLWNGEVKRHAVPVEERRRKKNE